MGAGVVRLLDLEPVLDSLPGLLTSSPGASAMSVSGWKMALLALLCLLAARLGAMVLVGAMGGGCETGFGGPGAIATTVLAGFSLPPELPGVVAVPAEPAFDLGESASLPLADVGVVADVGC